MKKITLYMLIALLICSVLPQAALAESDAPTLIYLAKDFESQEAGELPYGFSVSDVNHYSVAVSEKEDNTSNKAIKVTGSSSTKWGRHSLCYAPISKDFIISFNVKQSELNIKKTISLCLNATESKASYYLEPYGAGFTLMTLNKTLTVGKTNFTDVTFKADEWYNIAYDFNMSEKKVYVYIDGTNYGYVALPSDIINVCEFRLYAPSEGGEFFLDDVRIYESDEILSEDDFGAELARWQGSDFCPPEKYELGRLYQYDKFIYYALYNKFVTRINGTKAYKDNKYHNIEPIIYEGEKIIAPVRSFADLFGASTGWEADTSRLTVTYNGKTLETVENSDIYYLNGKPSKLLYPANIKNGTLYMSLDILAKFFGIDYTVTDDIINFGDEITVDHDLGPMEVNGRGKTLYEEVMVGISNSLIYDRPTAQEAYDIYTQINPTNAHPRIFVNDFNWIAEGKAKDPRFASTINTTVITPANDYVADGPITVRLYDGLRSTAGSAASQCATLALAYQITRDDKYKNAIWAQIAEIEKYGSLNPNHFLDTGTAATGLGKTYSWMYNDMSDTEKARLEKIIYEWVLLKFEAGFKAPNYTSATAFAYGGGNQPLIINGGGIICAIALMDKYPELCSEIIANALKSVELAFDGFAPDGAWVEGISYWLYTCDYLPGLFNSLDCAFGTDFGLSKAPGLMNTINFALSQKGSVTAFPVGDASEQGFGHGIFMWQAKKTGDKALAALRKNHLTHLSTIDLFNWVFDTDGEDGDINNIEGDLYQRKVENISMRTGWDKSDTAVLFHGGGNNDGHGHIDIGSFQFDMNGLRWATEVPKEDYNLTVYGSYEADGTYNEYTGAQYYRNGGEGHNVVVANIGADNPYGMEKDARGEIIEKAFGDEISYGIMDLTQSNDIFTCGRRGVMLDKQNNRIIVQDSYSAEEATEFWWFMHLKDTTVDISDDGKTAILTKSGKSIKASIISEGTEGFTVLQAKHLTEQLEGYDTVIPPLQTANDGYTKLAVQSGSTDNLKLTVVFGAVDDTETENIPMEQWKALVK